MFSPSKDLLFDLLRVLSLFVLFPYLVYQASLKDFFSPDFIFYSTILFLLFILSVLVALGVLVDLRRSLEEEKSILTALVDLFFFLFFVFTSSLALSYFVRGVVYQIFSNVY